MSEINKPENQKEQGQEEEKDPISEINNILFGFTNIMVSDVLKRHGVTPSPIPDEQKEELRKLVEGLQQQANQLFQSTKKPDSKK